MAPLTNCTLDKYQIVLKFAMLDHLVYICNINLYNQDLTF